MSAVGFRGMVSDCFREKSYRCSQTAQLGTSQAFEVLSLCEAPQVLAEFGRYSTYLYLDSPVVPFKTTNLLCYL